MLVEEYNPYYDFTPREEQVKRLRLKGWSAQKIANEFGVTKGQVETTLRHISKKERRWRFLLYPERVASLKRLAKAMRGEDVRQQP